MKKKTGTRQEVMNGIAKMTGGGLRKKDLKINNKGKIVSKKLSKIAKEINNLQIGGGDTVQFVIEDMNRSLMDFLIEAENDKRLRMDHKKITSITLDVNGKVINWPGTPKKNVDSFLMKEIKKHFSESIADGSIAIDDTVEVSINLKS